MLTLLSFSLVFCFFGGRLVMFCSAFVYCYIPDPKSFVWLCFGFSLFFVRSGGQVCCRAVSWVDRQCASPSRLAPWATCTLSGRQNIYFFVVAILAYFCENKNFWGADILSTQNIGNVCWTGGWGASYMDSNILWNETIIWAIIYAKYLEWYIDASL